MATAGAAPGDVAAGHARTRARLARVTHRRQPARAAAGATWRPGGRASDLRVSASGMLLSGRSLQWCARLAVWRDAAGPAPRVRWRWQTVTCHREGHDAAGGCDAAWALNRTLERVGGRGGGLRGARVRPSSTAARAHVSVGELPGRNRQVEHSTAGTAKRGPTHLKTT